MGEPSLLACMIMEALGVFALNFFGGMAASCSAGILGNDPVAGALAHMLALGIMIWVGAATCGANFNPAVTIALLLTGDGGMNVMKALMYIAAQTGGSLLSGFAVLSLRPTWTGVANGTAGSWGSHEYKSSYPNVARDGAGGLAQACLGEFWATFFLVFMVYCTAVDSEKKKGAPSAYGLAIGGTVGMSAFGIGGITGAALNPCRWLGPWIMAAFVKGNEPAAGGAMDFVPYMIMTTLGGATAGLLYKHVLRD